MNDCNPRQTVYRFTPSTGVRRVGQLAACKLRREQWDENGGCPCEWGVQCPFGRETALAEAWFSRRDLEGE